MYCIDKFCLLINYARLYDPKIKMNPAWTVRLTSTCLCFWKFLVLIYKSI